MSHYDCVLPIDWERFDTALQQWLRVLGSELSITDYFARYAPLGSDYVEANDIEQDQIVCDENYLRFFLERDYEDWNTVGFWQDDERNKQQRRVEKIFGTDDILMAAIKQSAAFELAGNDDLSHGDFTYYGRLHDAPHVQVAGTKNGYRFLNSLFGSNIRSSPSEKIRGQYIYRYLHRQEWPEALQYLLGKLLLGARCLPGVGILRLPPGTRADDSPQFMGFLSPAEVGQLLQFESHLMRAAELAEDSLFPLFADRLRRSHACGAGLISMQDGL